ncbi:ATP-binding protein [Streptomyces sp. NPDC007907]|uniref:ATP-binding protein n=1 Tax=Streptomyces sp. NPDC007907 TaxID=3364789 RepID=UPI0036EBA97B
MSRQVPETLFFGRAQELSQMGAWLVRAAGGEPQTVLIDGPAGIGKTSLLRCFLAGLTADHCVLRASGDELEMQLPYGIVTQLIPHRVHGVADAGAPQPDPISIGASLIDALGKFQDRAPVILVIDDVQWADTPSLHAITFVLRRLRVDRVLTVLVTRDAADPRLPHGLHRILEEDTTAKLTLAGLGVPELAQLNQALGLSPLPRWALARLRDHTYGNPLHTKALLQQYPGALLSAGDTVLPAPRRYERLIAERLDGCAPCTRRLVGAVSVVGMSAPLHVAAELAAVADPLEALAEAMTQELLIEGAAGAMPRAGFPHPLLRAAVYRGLDPGERSRLHRLAAGLSDAPGIALQHRVGEPRAGPCLEGARQLHLVEIEGTELAPELRSGLGLRVQRDDDGLTDRYVARLPERQGYLSPPCLDGTGPQLVFHQQHIHLGCVTFCNEKWPILAHMQDCAA